MQRDKLPTEQIIARRDTAGDRHREFATIRNEGVDCPNTIAQTSFVDLEPTRG